MERQFKCQRIQKS